MTGISISGGTLSWGGAFIAPFTGTIVDVNNDGALTVGEDYAWDPVWAYSGFTVEFEGSVYGVFIWPEGDGFEGGSAYIPYAVGDDLSGFPVDPGSTSTFVPVLTGAANCFLTGTMIATPAGEVAVETLHTGDLVLTADGRAVPVRWLARQTIQNIPFTLSPRLEPVVIAAGALGNGLPVTDLIVSADHGMILDALVANASAMVNGTSIRFVPLAEMPAEFTWWHVETAEHDVILANGAPTESFIDYTGRKAFDNYAEYLELYGADRLIREMPTPRISARRQLPPVLRERLGIDPATPDMGEIAHLLNERAA
ncbi:MAG: Hint domain-containing protein [Pararhodobacter sp.]